jgi:ketosteroid isomerase-like protein
MSEENVDVVMRSLWAFDHDRDIFLGTMTPDVEWYPYEENHAVSRGHEAALRIRDEWLEAWSDHEVAPTGVAHGGDSVIASIRITARGRTSGVDVGVELHMHFRLRDGRIYYVYEHEDLASALEAAGLPEDASRPVPAG